MMISTRGRYALRVMLDLAQHRDEGYVAMKTVADRQGISLKYMEKIMPALSKNGMVKGVHGKGGGYKLVREPGEYSVGEILRLAEGDLAPVPCVNNGNCQGDNAGCDRADTCPTMPMWADLYKMINDYFDKITLKDLMEKSEAGSLAND